MKSPIAAAVLTALVLAAVPTVADAATLRGTTSQGRTASLRTDANGIPTRVRIAWRARCKKPGFRSWDRTFFSPPFDAVSADAIADAGTYRVRYRGGLRGRITGSLQGQRTANGWRGTLRIKAVYAKRGKVTHVCRTGTFRWSVRPA
jgi:hypothetical protein